MRLLLIDNHDSYTYNLVQLVARVLGDTPLVLTNDDPRWAAFDTSSVDAVVVSPGPGRPQNPRDLGRVPDLLADGRLPVLGVCLGHQAIAHLAGADVVSAPQPRHGHLTRVRHTGRGLFAGVPQDFTAVRYHSLAVPAPLPEPLAATAWAEDDVVMALEHRRLPRWGVQFHPESVASDFGADLVANFLDMARAHLSASRPARASAGVRASAAEAAPAPPAAVHPRAPETPAARPSGAPRTLELPRAVDAEAAFCHLYGDAEYAFWLDSSRPQGPARFSFLGAATGEVLTYRVGGPVRVRDADGAEHHEPGSVFDALERRIGRPGPAPTGLPFDFTGGYVGYLGYECKADTGGAAAHTSSTPDAVWLRCDRFVAVDHVLGRTYAVCADGLPDGDDWLARTLASLDGLAPPAPPAPPAPAADLAPLLERPREGYVSDVKECLGQLTAGESYEICLTNRVRRPADGDVLDFYRRMRAANPAPYAALLRLGGVSVLSASPERFLRVEADRTAESRPIKGTAPRHPDPATDARAAEELRTGAKTRAENLMIVDLLRNDLGKVCEVGSVEVPAFMYTESYATVHQLVSTVRGRLRPDVSTVEAVRACFPGGSMTGAPKVRTMEIIDRLESSARGVYSGALGYLSHTGTADLNIVIRTAVSADGELTIGAGGAIVLDSDPEEEYEEMLLKAAVPARGL
ncbi:aminodeoxychorismate synthase component I [Nocardiopsis tropica]|uniref:aminodeoxychorismate synthase n=1 Tax=Nocardiopsis tropica TaxID=109330 RepID=A0ABV1ZNS0_9ACTN